MQTHLKWKMNRYFHLIFSLIIPITLICCGGKNKNPDPDDILLNVTNMAVEPSQYMPPKQFYELEKSIEDIKRQIVQLQTRVTEYAYKPSETNYTEKLKKLIDEPSPIHKIILKNGSIIEGTIEKDDIANIMVNTRVGKLLIKKNEIENIEDLILPMPDIIFIGHGQKEIIESYYLFSGKVLNQGGRRGDFVRIIYKLWGEDTQIISSDSAFVAGTQVRYKSGIVTDTSLDPNQSAHFSVQVSIESEIPISYITREIHWLLYD